MKRAETSDDSGVRRGTLVNALRIGDERDGQIVLCYNRKFKLSRYLPQGLSTMHIDYSRVINLSFLYHF